MIRELLDFFEGQGRFVTRNEYVGMQASFTPQLFIDYFDGLEPLAKQEMMHTLVAVALGRYDTLITHVLDAMQLLLGLCIHNYISYVAERQIDLEEEFNEPSHIAEWIQANDMAGPLEGLAAKKDWHYPLILWGVLYLLQSEQIQVPYNKLLEEAQSQSFRRALLTAKHTYDALVLGGENDEL